MPKFSVGDEAIIQETSRICYIREVMEDRHDPYYTVTYYRDDLSLPVDSTRPRLLFWEHELIGKRKARVQRNGREPLIE